MARCYADCVLSLYRHREQLSFFQDELFIQRYIDASAVECVFAAERRSSGEYAYLDLLEALWHFKCK